MSDLEEDPEVLIVSQEEYDWLLAELEKPAKFDPKLAALFNEPSIFDKDLDD